MKQFEVIWTKNAEFDLELIIEYIKTNSFEIAKKIFFEIKKECKNLYYFPPKKKDCTRITTNRYFEIPRNYP